MHSLPLDRIRTSQLYRHETVPLHLECFTVIKVSLISYGRITLTSKLYRHKTVPLHLQVFITLIKVSFSNHEPCHSVLIQLTVLPKSVLNLKYLLVCVFIIEYINNCLKFTLSKYFVHFPPFPITMTYPLK